MFGTSGTALFWIVIIVPSFMQNGNSEAIVVFSLTDKLLIYMDQDML